MAHKHIERHVMIGAAKRLRYRFSDEDGDPSDPTTIDVTIRKPDGTEDTLELTDLTPENTGVFSHIVEFDQAGARYKPWSIWMRSTGVPTTALSVDVFVDSPY